MTPETRRHLRAALVQQIAEQMTQADRATNGEMRERVIAAARAAMLVTIADLIKDCPHIEAHAAHHMEELRDSLALQAEAEALAFGAEGKGTVH